MALDTSSRPRRSIVNAIFVYSICVLAITIWTELKAKHPVIWIAVLAASIPIFAAVLGAFLNGPSDER